MPKSIQLPISKDDISQLRIGDEVLISGTMITARDAAHKLMVEDKPEFLKPLLENSFIYHCGPVIADKEGVYSFLAAGPTTSIREEPYEDKVIEHYNVRGVIGKGGMGPQTLSACKEHKAVYLHATGGAAPLLAQCVTTVKDVHMLKEFGVPEAMWVIEVKDFPAIVTMDSTGASLHESILSDTKSKRNALLDTF